MWIIILQIDKTVMYVCDFLYTLLITPAVQNIQWKWAQQNIILFQVYNGLCKPGFNTTVKNSLIGVPMHMLHTWNSIFFDSSLRVHCFEAKQILSVELQHVHNGISPRILPVGHCHTAQLANHIVTKLCLSIVCPYNLLHFTCIISLATDIVASFPGFWTDIDIIAWDQSSR